MLIRFIFISHFLRLDVIRLKWRITKNDESFVLVNIRWPVTYPPLRVYTLYTFQCHCLHDFRGSNHEWMMHVYFFFTVHALADYVWNICPFNLCWIIMNLYLLNHIITKMFAKHIHIFVLRSAIYTQHEVQIWLSFQVLILVYHKY